MTDSESLKALASTEAIELMVKDQKTGRSSSRPTLGANQECLLKAQLRYAWWT
jgi:hypothetical protein